VISAPVREVRSAANAVRNQEPIRRTSAVVAMEDGAVRLEFVRIEYDVAAAAAAIRRSELPEDFAGYLERGGDTAASISR
jgi:hypothetical protein